MNLREIVDTARYRLGLVSREELWRELNPDREKYIDEELPTAIQGPFREMCNMSMDLQRAKDPEALYKSLGNYVNLAQTMMRTINPKEAADDNREKAAGLLAAESVVNYQPAGSRMWKFFFNPMGVFTFIGEGHWAVKAANSILRTEITEEGFKYNYHPSVTPERLHEVDRRFKDIGLHEFAIDTAIRFMNYANVYTLVGHNMMTGQPNKLINLEADRMWPVFEYNDEVLTGWKYSYGHGMIPYSVDEVLHLKDFSLKSKYMGTPRLAPLITDIESDLAASALTAAIMNKAGMIGIIIALEDPSIQNPLRPKNMEREQERLQNMMRTNFSGVRGAHSVLVANYIRDVYKLTDIGSLDANFLKLRTEVARCVCILLGVPPERLSIPRTASIQYQAASVEDIVNSTFDKHLSALMKTVYGFINEEIVKKVMGIYDVEIAPRGRFSSNTLNGARMAYLASQTGPLFDVNENRSFFYRLPELAPGDPRGSVVCDNSFNRKPDSNPAQKSKADPRNQIGLMSDVEQTDAENDTDEEGDS